jgi:hypothetical protein
VDGVSTRLCDATIKKSFLLGRVFSFFFIQLLFIHYSQSVFSKGMTWIRQLLSPLLRARQPSALGGARWTLWGGVQMVLMTF